MQLSAHYARRTAPWIRKYRRPICLAVAAAVVSANAVALSSSSAQSVQGTWNAQYPQTISYRVLGQNRNVKCGQTDATFLQQMRAEGLEGYQIYVVAGHRGICARLKAEQLKRVDPSKMVILYENTGGDDPTTWPGGTWAGYYLLMNRSVALTAITTQQTQITVADPAAFSVGDTAVMWSPTAGDAYANSEWVSVNAINGSTLTVGRDMFATGRRSYTQAPLIAAAASGPSHPYPAFNLSNIAPINPVNGLRAKRWLADNMVNDFAPSFPGAPTLDAVEFDTAASTAPVSNTNGAVKNLDCNGDGLIDYCNRVVGTAKQVNAYGAGFDGFLRAVKRGIAIYDTDPTRPPKLVLADGEMGLRSVSSADGAEFESFPSWDNYAYSSGALATLGAWQAPPETPGTRLSYAFTKDITPLYPAVSSDNRGGCVTPANGGSCRNGSYRYGLAAALLWGGASAYNNEDNFMYSQRWDEEATINQATTGLAPGYLGVPIGPPTRTTRYSTGNLVTNPSLETDLVATSTATSVADSILMSRDTTTGAPGWGTASVRADVTRLSSNPLVSDMRVAAGMSTPVSPGEYTVDFWAKALNTAGGPSALNFGVTLQGAAGAAQTVLLTDTWTHYYLQVNANMLAPKATVKFHIGAQVGSYWIDGVNVHRGTAGILTRQFTHGIAVLNDSFTSQTDVVLPGGPYHRINGVQDRSVNNGTTAGSLLASVGAKDGIVLLRG